jgi:hypothetical protein
MTLHVFVILVLMIALYLHRKSDPPAEPVFNK